MIKYHENPVDDTYIERFTNSNKVAIVPTIDGYKYKCNGAKCEIDYSLKKRLDMDLVAVANQWDLVYAISGMEGSGKSKGATLTVATYICHKLRKSLSLKNIIFTPKQFEELVEDAKPFDVIFWDEFVLGGSSEDTLTEMQRSLKKKFTIIRSKRLIILLVIPYFHMMSKYWAISRTRMLVDCTSSDGISRGEAKVYGYGKKRYAYLNGKKLHTMEPFKHDFMLRFLDLGNKEITGKDIINWEEYEKKKQESSKEIEKKKENRGILTLKYRQALKAVSTNMKKDGFKYTDISSIMNDIISTTSIKTWVTEDLLEKGVVKYDTTGRKGATTKETSSSIRT